MINLWKRAALCLPVAAVVGMASLPAPARTPVAVTPLDTVGLKKQIAARKGKVVVLNYWATWCGPCVEEFPSLVKLHNSNKAKGLELVTVSCDEPEDAKKANAFLSKLGVSSGAFINKEGQDISGHLKFLEPKLSDTESIGIPRTYIFDRNGKLVKQLIGGQSYAQFQSAVAPYLKK